jgi:dTDP-4-amino-4,6-dideoxygalactose transaminase
MDKIKRFFKYDFFIFLLDIIAVNASYFLALVLRFSLNGRMDPLIDKYLDTVIYFAPIYTLICIILFFAFRLYGGMWRYAGIADVNRILFANVITALVHVVATVLFYQRMPITYYVMGASIQLVAIGAIRFSYRLAILEKRQITKSNAINALVIGTKENGSQTLKLLSIGIKYRPVAIIDCDSKDAGKLMNGIPVYGKNEFEAVVNKNKIKAVFLADSGIDKEFRKDVIKLCKEHQIQFGDYTSFFSYKGDVDSFDEILQTQQSQSSDEKKSIPFSPPDIGDAEINEVIETMKSGWITTGPRVKLLERRLAAFIETGKTDYDTESNSDRWSNRVACLYSATAAEELNLRILGIGEGDEVIVPAYSYTASASAAVHCGATIKFVDIQKDGDSVTHMPEMDYDALEKAITEKTKAIITVDLGGIICDYDRVFDIVERKRALFIPKESDGKPLGDLSSRIQKSIGRVAIVADGAHSLGASRMFRGEKKYCGAIADFTSYSFHAVKNFTTAEGGASTWTTKEGIDNAEIYHMYQLLSLHGQSKDALAKTKVGAWEYDIVGPWYKCNMTDITAAIGLRQLDRYAGLLDRRVEIIKKYDEACDRLGISHLVHHTDYMDSSNHLYLIRIPDITVEKRNELITKMAEQGVSTNVHYKPMPMMTAYKDMGWDIKDFPNTYDYYHNLITLPLHTRLSDDDVGYIIEKLENVVRA